jgi:hypothetical protein
MLALQYSSLCRSDIWGAFVQHIHFAYSFLWAFYN